MSDQTQRRKFIKQLLATGSVAWISGGSSSSAKGEILPGGYTNPVPFTTQDPTGPNAPLTLNRSFFEITPGADPYQVFSLSVASGDPRPHGIVLWTRLVPERITTGPVAYQIAHDRSFAPGTLIVEGLAEPNPARDYTVKLPLEHPALREFTTYYYRFIYNGTASRTGRFKTLPRKDQSIDRVRFAFVSCQDYSNGYYTALFHLAQENLDFVVHLGDYIYETVDDLDFQGQQVRSVPALPSRSKVASSLEDYRHLYRVYRSDRNLQAVHENFAVIQIWDDHEFANDSYQASRPDNITTTPAGPSLRQAANQAWAEHGVADAPFDPAKPPTESIRIYRSFRFGRLLELIATDERLYRDGPPCGQSTFDRYLATRCPAAETASRTMLGETQRNW